MRARWDFSDLVQVCPERKARNVVDFPRAAPQETSVLVYVRESAPASQTVEWILCFVWWSNLVSPGTKINTFIILSALLILTRKIVRKVNIKM